MTHFLKHAAITLWLLGSICVAQESERLVLWAHHGSSGPFGGQKGLSCLMLHSDGRIVQKWSSTSAFGVKDEKGNVAHAVETDSREYRFPDGDSWQVSGYLDFVQSKPVQRLASIFPPPHRPIDFFETSTIRIFLTSRQVKQVEAREYYVASLEEKVKYPSALIVLMDELQRLEKAVVEKGTPAKTLVDCEQGIGSIANRVTK